MKRKKGQVCIRIGVAGKLGWARKAFLGTSQVCRTGSEGNAGEKKNQGLPLGGLSNTEASRDGVSGRGEGRFAIDAEFFVV